MYVCIYACQLALRAFIIIYTYVNTYAIYFTLTLLLYLGEYIYICVYSICVPMYTYFIIEYEFETIYDVVRQVKSEN